MTRKEIKARAREDLGNNIFCASWLLVVVAALIVAIILCVANIVPVPVIGCLLLVGPMTVGFYGAFLAAARAKRCYSIGEIFSNAFNENFGRNFLLGLLKYIFICLWSMLFVIPGIVKTYSYALAQFIAYDHPEYSWQQCIDESRKMMDGNKGKLFVQDLSFIGWAIVGNLCLGIGSPWVAAYQQAARVEFYRALINDSNTVTAE